MRLGWIAKVEIHPFWISSFSIREIVLLSKIHLVNPLLYKSVKNNLLTKGTRWRYPTSKTHLSSPAPAKQNDNDV